MMCVPKPELCQLMLTEVMLAYYFQRAVRTLHAEDLCTAQTADAENAASTLPCYDMVQQRKQNRSLGIVDLNLFWQ